ncbi:MAG TPA: SDR family NAD(P)-dependent oxidoreductase [Acidimicrobiales bacterium]
MDLGLKHRAAVVTGASRGIGHHIALALAAEGCRVLLCARDADALAAVEAELGGAGVRFPVDVTAPDAAAAIVAECQRAFGRLDVVVNNAGTAVPKPLAELTAGDWQAGLEVNFLAAARLSVAAVPAMQAAGWGRLVHVASTNGREPDPLFAPYSAAKAALLNLSTALSRAFAADGVLSSCVVPGVTVTELVEANALATAERTGRPPAEVMQRMLAKQGVAAGRFGRPEEVAAAVVFLASEAAAWITGATLEVDGGTLRSV